MCIPVRAIRTSFAAIITRIHTYRQYQPIPEIIARYRNCVRGKMIKKIKTPGLVKYLRLEVSGLERKS